MAELVLTLNTFEFNGEYYKQVGGVAMGSRLGPNYACLFAGSVEERMLAEYTGRKPDFYKRYMDNVAGVASGSEQDLQQFLDFASKYHPKLVYTWSISSDKLPFLDIYMTPRDDRISTSICYKDTDSHSYLNVGSSHIHPSVNRPYHIVSFYGCERSAVRTTFFKMRPQPWRLILLHEPTPVT